MKKSKIEYRKEQTLSPASYWVHIEKDSNSWYQAEGFDPPKQGPVKGLGYPLFLVEYDSLRLEFSSLYEIEHYIEILSQKNMPSSLALTKRRAISTPKIVSFNPERSQWGIGPNRHWLSRLPAKAKPWRFREGLVKYLSECLEKFRKEISNNM